MANQITVNVKRNGSPFIGIAAAITAVLLVVPPLTRPFNSETPQRKARTEKAITQPVYDEYARAIALLQAGVTQQAGVILDNYRTEPLSIVSGGYKTGVMAADSPTTLLIRLGRTINQEAMKLAKAGHTEEALLWVARLYGLKNQALQTTTPSFDAVQVAYFMDGQASRLESNVWSLAGKPVRAARAEAHRKQMTRIWSGQVLPQMKAWRQEYDLISARPVGNEPRTAAADESEEKHSRQFIGLLSLKTGA